MKRYWSILILLVLLIASTAFANMQSFTEEKIYSNNFSDVQETAWYYDSVKEVFELNLFNGISNDSFGPDSNITIAQAIKLASTIHSIYNNDNEPFKAEDGEQWYRPYVKYALNKKIIANEYLDYDTNATRSELVKILVKSLPDEELKAINEIELIPDVSISDKNGEDIYKFYNAGILSGSDKQGTFNPQSNIKRCEVAAIITRLVNPQKRLSFSLEYDPLEQYDFVDDVLGVNVKDYSYYFSGKGDKSFSNAIWLHEDMVYTLTYKFDKNTEFTYELVNNDGDIPEMIEETPDENENTSKLFAAYVEGEPLRLNVKATGNWEIIIVPIYGKTELSISGKSRFVSKYFVAEYENYILSYSNKGNSPIEFWISPKDQKEWKNSVFESEPRECNIQKEIKLEKDKVYYYDVRLGAEWSISLEPKNESSIEELTKEKDEAMNKLLIMKEILIKIGDSLASDQEGLEYMKQITGEYTAVAYEQIAIPKFKLAKQKINEAVVLCEKDEAFSTLKSYLQEYNNYSLESIPTPNTSNTYDIALKIIDFTDYKQTYYEANVKPEVERLNQEINEKADIITKKINDYSK